MQVRTVRDTDIVVNIPGTSGYIESGSTKFSTDINNSMLDNIQLHYRVVMYNTVNEEKWRSILPRKEQIMSSL